MVLGEPVRAVATLSTMTSVWYSSVVLEQIPPTGSASFRLDILVALMVSVTNCETRFLAGNVLKLLVRYLS